MKNILFSLTLILLAFSINAQDTTATKTPPVSAIVGQVNYAGFSIFDSLQNPVVRYQSTGKDTVQVSWGVMLINCEQCIGERLFVRSMQMLAPGVNTKTYAVPMKNDNPAYDEAWETTLGTMYLILGPQGLPVTIFLKQPNNYSLRWSNPVVVSEKPK